MPWFVAEKDGQFCVTKGTKDKPGAVVKCHGDKKSATDHLRAIYANYKPGEKK